MRTIAKTANLELVAIGDAVLIYQGKARVSPHVVVKLSDLEEVRDALTDLLEAHRRDELSPTPF